MHPSYRPQEQLSDCNALRGAIISRLRPGSEKAKFAADSLLVPCPIGQLRRPEQPLPMSTRLCSSP